MVVMRNSIGLPAMDSWCGESFHQPGREDWPEPAQDPTQRTIQIQTSYFLKITEFETEQ